VLAQTFQDFELLIVDDGSTDETPQVLEEIKLLDPRIQTIRLVANGGCSIARNAGFRKSRGEFVSFLDSDDEWVPTKLQKQLQLMQRSSDVGVVNCGIIILDGHGAELRRELRSLRGRVSPRLLATGSDVASMWLFRRASLEQLEGPYDDELINFQVIDLIVRIGTVAQFDFVSEDLVIKHEHDSLPKNGKYDIEIHLRCREVFARKHRALLEADPGWSSIFLTSLVGLYVEADRLTEARKCALRALKANPWRPRSWAFFVFAILGPSSLLFARRLKKLLHWEW